MTLRGKLLLAQAPLALALAAVSILATTIVSSLSRHSDAILQDNYRSVLAVQRMQESVERLHDFAALQLLDALPTDAETRAAKERAQFANELHVEENNITEPGEQEAADRLHREWDAYLRDLDHLRQLSDKDAAKALFLNTVDPAFVAVKRSAETILAMNQDAMMHKSTRARFAAERLSTTVLLGSLAALVLGILLSGMMTNRLMQPLSILTHTVHRIGDGDFDSRVEITGNDELAQLAGSVNSMAARLSEYRRSSLGELLMAQQASQAAIDSLPDPVLVFDARGDVSNVNRAAETLLHAGVGFADTALANAGVETRAILERVKNHVLAGKGPYVPRGFDEALPIPSPEGERFLLPRGTPVYGETGGIAGLTVVLQDITRLRRVDELRNDLVATLAHEFRTPLTSLRLAIHLCIEQIAGPVTDKQADLLQAARDDCERLQLMVDELLDLARIQGGQVELQRHPIATEALVHKAIAVHRAGAEERGVEIVARIRPGTAAVSVDRERIQLVLSNLISNALRHTPQGGRIEIRAHVVNGHVRFEVSDSGPGIPKEYRHSVFEKFFRVPGAASGGAGIGLSMAKEIVEAHDGEIGVDNGEIGATFWFTLPALVGAADDAGAVG